jgi:apolipoprotein N-acyltransferase
MAEGENSFILSGMLQAGLVLLSALMMWAAFPPLGLAPLAFVAPVPLFLAVRSVERSQWALLLGFGWGAAFFGLLLNWIMVLGFVAWFPLSILMGTFTALFALWVWTFRLWTPWRWFYITIGGWVALEFLRGHFPFGGFPWGDIGYPAASLPGAIGSVQWIGPSGWSVLVVAVAAGLTLVIENHKIWKFSVDSIAVVMLVMIAGTFLGPAPAAQVWRTAIVQGGSPCPQTHCQNETKRIYERHIELTRAIPEGTVEFVVWPENSVGTPYEPDTNEEVRTEIIEQARRLDSYILISGTRVVGDDQFINFNALYSPDGVKVGEYRKRHPVPFGEYVPLRELFGFVPQLDQVPRDMISGMQPIVFPTEQGIVGSVISFEGAFARSMRSIARSGAQIMIVATNESSYGISAASDQLIGLVRVNSAGVGLDTALAAITGKSVFITAGGEVGTETELLESTVLFGSVQFTTDVPTIWVRFGDWFAVIAVLVATFAIALPGVRSSDPAELAPR